MKKLLFLLSFSLVTIIAISQTVHYTETGSKYHSSGCRYLRRSDYSCTLQEALNMGLSSCSRCSPPREVIKKTTKKVIKKKRAKKRNKKVTYFFRYNGSSNISLPAQVQN
jgi:hypothetical protein